MIREFDRLYVSFHSDLRTRPLTQMPRRENSTQSLTSPGGNDTTLYLLALLADPVIRWLQIHPPVFEKKFNHDSVINNGVPRKMSIAGEINAPDEQSTSRRRLATHSVIVTRGSVKCIERRYSSRAPRANVTGHRIQPSVPGMI